MTSPLTVAPGPGAASVRWTPRLSPSRKVLAAGLLGAAATISGLALTATSGWLIVRASGRPVILTLLVAIVAVRTFGLARPVLRYAERLRSHDAALSDLAEQRTQVYAGLVPLTPARLGRRSRSEVLGGVVDDLTDVVESQARVTAPVLGAGGAAVAACVFSALLLPTAGLVLTGLLVVVAVLCRVAWVAESESQQRLLAARAEVLHVSELVARQAGELQAIGASGTAQRWLLDAQGRFSAEARAQSRGRALLSAGILCATGAATAVTAWFVAGAAAQGVVSRPVAALLVLVPVAVGEALGSLPDAIRALARARASATRLERLLDQDPAVAAAVTTAEGGLEEPLTPAPHLQVKAVSASWLAAGLRSAVGSAAIDLPPTDLELPPGGRVAVVGANGTGKSTLVAVLARHLDPSGGRYTVDGRDVRDLSLADVRGLFAIVDDEPHVFATTLRENLRLAGAGEPAPADGNAAIVSGGDQVTSSPDPSLADAALVAALHRAGLGEWLARLPEGLDTRLGTGGRGVSGGERARLGLARAFLSGRPILLLDEPVAHLDHATATAVLADLAASASTRSVVMVTHRPEGLEHFDAVLDLTPAGTSAAHRSGG